jgi:hypothetical protein
MSAARMLPGSEEYRAPVAIPQMSWKQLNKLDVCSQQETAPKSHSKSALWASLLAALAVIMGSLGPFRIRESDYLYRHIRIYGIWYTTPHTLVHIVAFGLLGNLAWAISRRWPLRAAGITGALVLGLAIEWLQLKSYPNIIFETWDLRSDAIGVGLGVLLGYATAVLRSRPGRTFTA